MLAADEREGFSSRSELRTDAALREQVLDVLVVHRHLIPTARRGHYMMVVPHD